MDEKIKQTRTDTPGCKGKIHLNNAGAGLMPTPVLEAIKDYLDLESQIGGYESAAFKKKEIAGFYDSVGQLVNAQAHNIACTANATDAYARAISSVVFQPEDIILTTNDDYISNQIAFIALRKRFGISIHRIPNAPEGGLDLEAARKLIVELNPKLVSISHMPTNSGLIQPVNEVGVMCRENDILYLVDACQSTGQLQIDVNKMQCDFLSATSRKFLRGPRGCGFLYVSDRVLEQNLEPLFIDMRGANWTGADTYELYDGARRFEDWEFAYALLLGTKAAADYALSLGTDWIEERSKYLGAYLRNALSEMEYIRLLDIGKDLGAIVTLHNEKQSPVRMNVKCQRANINIGISRRENAVIDFGMKNVDAALRVSPHYYNTEEEIDQFVDVIRTMSE